MAQFTIYTSEDVNAPVLNGNTGSLITVLNACLVNGYGSKPGAGWTKPFPDTSSMAVYKTDVSGISASYFAINDGVTGASGQDARLWGLESFTAWGTATPQKPTGSGLFPTTAQTGNGTFIRKSTATGVVSRPWLVFADSGSVYFMTLSGDGTAQYCACMFGEFYSLMPNDAYRTMIAARSVEGSSTITNDTLDTVLPLNLANNGTYAAKSYTGLGGSIGVAKHGMNLLTTNFVGTLGGALNQADNGIYISSLWVHELTPTIRGRMRGFYHLLNPPTSFVHGQTFTGTGEFAGKTFMVIKPTANGNGTFVFETSDTLETN